MTEATLVHQLAEAVTRKGRVVAMDQMDPADRRYTESLLDQISRLRVTEQVAVGMALDVHEFRRPEYRSHRQGFLALPSQCVRAGCDVTFCIVSVARSMTRAPSASLASGMS